MSSSGEFSESQIGGAGEVATRDNSFSRLSSSKPADGDELRRRLAEARARTQELISHYVDSCSRLNMELASQREAAAVRAEIRSELSASVIRYAILLRALGEPPERTLVVIKTAFSEAAPHQDDDNRAVLEDIVKWVVDAYYAV
jgi:hypothetical protein